MEARKEWILTMWNDQLVRETLVREIRDAKRGSAVEDAMYALLKVRRMAKQHQEEMDHLYPKDNGLNTEQTKVEGGQDYS